MLLKCYCFSGVMRQRTFEASEFPRFEYALDHVSNFTSKCRKVFAKCGQKNLNEKNRMCEKNARIVMISDSESDLAKVDETLQENVSSERIHSDLESKPIALDCFLKKSETLDHNANTKVESLSPVIFIITESFWYGEGQSELLKATGGISPCVDFLIVYHNNRLFSNGPEEIVQIVQMKELPNAVDKILEKHCLSLLSSETKSLYKLFTSVKERNKTRAGKIIPFCVKHTYKY